MSIRRSDHARVARSRPGVSSLAWVGRDPATCSRPCRLLRCDAADQQARQAMRTIGLTCSSDHWLGSLIPWLKLDRLASGIAPASADSRHVAPGSRHDWLACLVVFLGSSQSHVICSRSLATPRRYGRLRPPARGWGAGVQVAIACPTVVVAATSGAVWSVSLRPRWAAQSLDVDTQG